ncbi:MAG: hypothetical protein PHY36_05580 [Methanocellales archaeon]|nr:hypothetical protein [Methanocellales archaeon]
MKEELVDVQILDNFYQVSGFFPMPVVLISTLAETGQTNLAPYSLCFPYLIIGRHAMLLITRETSNTAQNIKRTGLCAINFIPDAKKYMRNCVMLGYPGETTEEKMRNNIFTLLPSTRAISNPDMKYPEIVEEAEQVFECTWLRDYPLKPCGENQECHFVLEIDKIVMKNKWKECLSRGKGFPRLPIGYGYRDNLRFWFSRHNRSYAVSIPKEKGVSVEDVMYAAGRIDPDIKWQEAACAKMVKVPRIFLNQALKACVKAAKSEGLTEVTPELVDRVRDKRSGEKP